MNGERLDRAINKITDANWSPVKAFTDDDTGINPEFITKGEAKVLKAVGRVIPQVLMYFVVRQFAGEEGENVFIESLYK
jgi:hypothetical protein